ncbi:MAG TPA: D-aminoacyl-tRNA deacylase [Candidatus Limnocylindrales bacterium]
MRAVVQRVLRAAVRVDGRVVGEVGTGCLVLLGIGLDDDVDVAATLARRIADLRMFADASGRTNLSISDIGGRALVVSQFTLYADLDHGRRPGFTGAAPAGPAETLYEAFCRELSARGVPVERGAFGASMEVELVNDGPFTLWLDVPGGSSSSS